MKKISTELVKGMKGYKKYYALYADEKKVGCVYKMGSDWSFCFDDYMIGNVIPNEVFRFFWRYDVILVKGHEVLRMGKIDYYKLEHQLEAAGFNTDDHNVYLLGLENQMIPSMVGGSISSNGYTSMDEALEIAKIVIEADYFKSIPVGEDCKKEYVAE